ncbi:TonB system transport protein ExbD [Komagataeibacter nataicola]|uniref:Biopolymer transport protein ExbD n=1 Tax=Komagataeibacter nataicola TaxID=265960 RepID=A0A9N7H2U3_9PROT|nr:TonB system transport protein ExbD [Komagataeibacter nataicola]AQU89132.1 TonB system transport protein ExbD [Komagataeibacter nataicola]PYD67240.1 TonB system transport protein ExbD [Komagataeibacter nataicola]WEQ57302.1 TonB system transport protein ExbD [Komagataeibacter nataicola]WNM09992.1 TonB system transport protein ExbD [Komagataeibacter nataicola]GBR17434.1 ExbD/TolR proton channel family protein [Komagataeibacter nataicola NRIC 0616]
MHRIRHGDESANEAHEINVTPFIDVMLVLLVIFMVTAPLTTVNVPVDLPSSTEKPLPRPDAPVFLTVKADHGLALGEDDVTADSLPAALATATQGNRDERIFLRADKTVDYGTLMGVMDRLRTAGYLKVALVNLQNAAEGSVAP